MRIAATMRMERDRGNTRTRGIETFIAGLTGAVAVNVVHQLGQRLVADAPRMDIVGMRALAGLREHVGASRTDPDTLYSQTLAGDVVSNALYYTLVGVGGRRGRWQRAAALGLAAGFGALVLPKPMGLGDPPHSDSRRNQVLTVAWYTIGGLAAAGMLELLDPAERRASGDGVPHERWT